MYKLVLWPESQLIMDKEWLNECFLAQSMDENQDWVGAAAYFVPENRMYELEQSFSED